MRLLIVLLAAQCLCQPTFAATIGQCLDQTENNAAAKRCRELIDAGNHSEDVYVRLASALNSIGKRSEAYSAIEEGLSKHTSSRDLKDLKIIVRSNLSEDEYLKSQANNNPNDSAVKKGQLKVLKLKCLKKSGQEAMDACSQFTQIGGIDAEVSARQESMIALNTTPEYTDSDPNAVGQTQQPQENRDNSIVGSITSDITTELASDASTDPIEDTNRAPNTTNSSKPNEIIENNNRRLVRSIQLALNDLGLDAGVADGIEGKKTRTAIDEFYSITKFSPPRQVGEELLTDLQDASLRESSAKSLYDQTSTLISSGNFEQAQLALSDAQSTAPWVTEPHNLSQRLSSARATNLKRLADEKRAQDQQLEQQNRNRNIQELIARAEQALLQEELTDARNSISQAEVAGADKAILSNLKAKLGSLQAEQDKKLRITSLITDAKRSVELSNLSQALEILDKADGLDEQLANTSELRSEIQGIQNRQLAEQRKANQTRENQAKKDEIDLLVNRGNILKESGNTNQAKVTFEQVLAIDPSNQVASDAIIALNTNSTSATLDSKKLDEILQRAKVMRINREKKHTEFTKYMEIDIPEAIDRLFE